VVTYNPETKKAYSQITLFLTPEEALELSDSCRDLASNPEKHHHHVPDSNFEREITVAVFTKGNLAEFDHESRALLEAALRNSCELGED
jgi:hypothetical protein